MTTVAIAISNDVLVDSFIFNKLDLLLKNLSDYKIEAINDSKQALKIYADNKSVEITFKNCNSRIGAKQICARATHLIIFWTGLDLSDLIFFATQKRIPVKIVPISVTTVANKDTGQPFDVYIGRGSPLGNPFPIEHGTEQDRSHVIDKYRKYFYDEIITSPEKKKYIEGLRGLRLGCHCKPLPCHGDVIAEYLNNSENKKED